MTAARVGWFLHRGEWPWPQQKPAGRACWAYRLRRKWRLACSLSSFHCRATQRKNRDGGNSFAIRIPLALGLVADIVDGRSRSRRYGRWSSRRSQVADPKVRKVSKFASVPQRIEVPGLLGIECLRHQDLLPGTQDCCACISEHTHNSLIRYDKDTEISIGATRGS